MNNKKILSLNTGLLITLILGGCTATGKPFREADPEIDIPNKATLYIYRKQAWAFSARTASFA